MIYPDGRGRLGQGTHGQSWGYYKTYANGVTRDAQGNQVYRF